MIPLPPPAPKPVKGYRVFKEVNNEFDMGPIRFVSQKKQGAEWRDIHVSTNLNNAIQACINHAKHGDSRIDSIVWNTEVEPNK